VQCGVDYKAPPLVTPECDSREALALGAGGPLGLKAQGVGTRDNSSISTLLPPRIQILYWILSNGEE
jgi:hypothetical protein